jgi:hypothetical protein
LLKGNSKKYELEKVPVCNIKEGDKLLLDVFKFHFPVPTIRGAINFIMNFYGEWKCNIYLCWHRNVLKCQSPERYIYFFKQLFGFYTAASFS